MRVLRDLRDGTAMGIGPSKLEMIIVFNDIIPCLPAHPGPNGNCQLSPFNSSFCALRPSYRMSSSIPLIMRCSALWTAWSSRCASHSHGTFAGELQMTQSGSNIIWADMLWLVGRDGECGVILLPKNLTCVGEGGSGIRVQTRGRRGAISDAASKLYVREKEVVKSQSCR